MVMAAPYIFRGNDPSSRPIWHSSNAFQSTCNDVARYWVAFARSFVSELSTSLTYQVRNDDLPLLSVFLCPVAFKIFCSSCGVAPSLKWEEYPIMQTANPTWPGHLRKFHCIRSSVTFCYLATKIPICGPWIPMIEVYAASESGIPTGLPGKSRPYAHCSVVSAIDQPLSPSIPLSLLHRLYSYPTFPLAHLPLINWQIFAVGFW